MFENSAREFILHAFAKLRHDQSRFSSVHFNFVQDHLPFLSGVTQEYVDQLCMDPHSTSQFFQVHRRNNSKFNALEEMEEAVAESIRETASRAVTESLQQQPQCPEEVKADVREIFLKMLDAAYLAELSQGELDSREDNGFNYEALRQSVAFAVEDCHAGQEPLHDWSHANSFAFHDGADAHVRRFVDWFKTKFLHSQEKQSCTRAYQRLRIRVLRALVFIEAHRRAENELRSYLDNDLQDVGSVGMAAMDLENAILAVLEESKAQVREAEEWLLTGVPPQDLQTIRAHYMVTILLHKLSLYVEKAVSDGRLKEKEGRLFLTQIDQRVEKVHNCKRTHVEDGNTKRRRRKQKSTGSSMSSLDWNSDRPQDGGGGKKKRWRQKQKSTESTTSSLEWNSDRPQDVP